MAASGFEQVLHFNLELANLSDYPLKTLGLMWLEAIAVGCPVVSANSGGIPDIVTDGVNGFWFDPKDEEGAINATRQLQPSCHPVLAETSLPMAA